MHKLYKDFNAAFGYVTNAPAEKRSIPSGRQKSYITEGNTFDQVYLKK